jgi:hypothetical protein
MQLGAALVYETCGKHRGLPEFVSFQFKKRTFEKPWALEIDLTIPENA